jgi:hypothetical protein
VEAIQHWAYCRSDCCPELAERFSAKVTVDWHGHILSREYALP